MAFVEDTGKRSANAKHFFDADTGKWRAEFTIHHRHFHDGAAWQDIDESIVDDGAGGFDKKCDKTRHAIRIGTGGTQRWYPRRNVLTEYVEITNIQYWRTTGGGSWRSINLPAAVWKSQGADWDMTNLHVELINTWRQVKTNFVLKDNTAPTRLRFALTLVGLTLSTDTWEFTSTTDGLVWGSIPPPTFTDATSTEEAPVFVPVTTTYAGGYLEWSVNPTGYTYPLTSHSLTFTDGYGGDVTTAIDTYVRSSAATTNYGTNIALTAYNDGSIWRNVLMKFNISSLAGTTLDSASLFINSTSSIAEAMTLKFHNILVANSGWTEDGAKWDYSVGTTRWAGDSGSDGGADAGCNVSGTDYSGTELSSYVLPESTTGFVEVVLVITQVDDWLSANYGLQFHKENSSSQAATFASSDNETTGNRPYLVVLYTAAGGLSIPVAMHHYQFNLDR